ncbi:hypothetical protein OG800_48855 [Streptomyces sp. NBC_00445]|uniref:hypothetical protein n=1 Tax=Streptomyces sp. NBC_00445 TaxID=2975745 RepID=UPI002E1BED9D
MTQVGTSRENIAAQANSGPTDAGPHEDGGALEARGLTTLGERQLGVTHWLLTAAEDRARARAEWKEQGIALLTCGAALSAVRIPAHLVWGAARTEELEKVDDFLRRFFDGGAMFMDIHAHLYYALVPGTSEWRWTNREVPGVERLRGRSYYLGVPHIALTEPKGRSYWSLPMDTAGDLCYLDEVESLVITGLAARGEGVGR